MDRSAEVAELRRRADAIEAESCTGIAAVWCPVHGDCTCPVYDGSEHARVGLWVGERWLDHPNCPLHSPDSSHAEPFG